ncbi:MAG: NAD(P)/FAD-dependent oxidoreductase [Kordiimonadaceae bacterium]|mgnify:CR=1 FL=1|jgi:thioredoxin reductase (NADPH)|nr:NAD(P)/FAD-dependent oxidoreductase [Kordiimonadaceae bacterium]MBT6035747.1 NAD(P)/FAD-dependent oxidoreductase [Kordiimonadaceae bacterium]
MSDEVVKTDMIIVGAGPVGIFAVFEAGLLGLKCHLIDNLDRPGGQCTELYPEKPIYDIPGRPKVTGQELIDDLMLQCSPFDPQFHLNQQAKALKKLSSGHWQMTTSQGEVLEAPIVVVAAGAGSFVPKKPKYPELEVYEEKSVDYSVYKMSKYQDKELVLVGGGDSALDWVLSLQPLAKKITLVHRREGFRAAPDTEAQFKQLVADGKVDFIMGNIKALNGTDGQLENVGIETVDGDFIDVNCDYLLPFMGLKISLGPIAEWGLNLNKKHVEVDTTTFATDIPGIYAIGDVCTYPSKIKLILTGFYEAAVMCHAAFPYAFPDRKMATGYTTTNTAIQDRLGV